MVNKSSTDTPWNYCCCCCSSCCCPTQLQRWGCVVLRWVVVGVVTTSGDFIFLSVWVFSWAFEFTKSFQGQLSGQHFFTYHLKTWVNIQTQTDSKKWIFCCFYKTKNTWYIWRVVIRYLTYPIHFTKFQKYRAIPRGGRNKNLNRNPKSVQANQIQLNPTSEGGGLPKPPPSVNGDCSKTDVSINSKLFDFS